MDAREYDIILDSKDSEIRFLSLTIDRLQSRIKSLESLTPELEDKGIMEPAKSMIGADVASHSSTVGNSIQHKGGYYYELFKFFSEQHDLVLVDTEIQDIIHAVETFNDNPVRKIINEKK